MKVIAPRGTNDLFGNNMTNWREVESIIRNLCNDFGFEEIRTPIFEHTELFQRGIGDTTDIVQKEMYTFEDKKGRSLTLKPEGTAGVVRAFLERKIYADVQPTKLFYITPVFRYEKPQAGRYRQHHQFGVELFGSNEPTADAEVIAIGYHMLKRLGITKAVLNLNSLGGVKCRANYNKILKGYLKENYDSLCQTCKERYEKNPLRILDCKSEGCQQLVKEAPLAVNYLGIECKNHFEDLKKLLDVMDIEYIVNPWIVRGLDYYTNTVFEFISDAIGAQGTVCGGGRYNGLIEECGGSATPAVGFGAGLERLLMVREASIGKIEHNKSVDIYIGSMGEKATLLATKLVNQLREVGIKAIMDVMGKSVKAQMKYANKIGAKYSYIIGDNEINENGSVLKNMDTKELESILFDELVDSLKSKFEEPHHTFL